MCELWSVGILLSVGVGDGLIQRTAHRHMVGEIGGEAPIEIG